MRHISHMMYIYIYTWFIMDQFAFIIANFSIASFCSARSYQLYIISCHISTWPCCIISCICIMSIPHPWGSRFNFQRGFPMCPSGLWRSFLYGCGGSKLWLAANSLEGTAEMTRVIRLKPRIGRLEFEFQHPINLGFWRGGEPGYFWESCLEGHDASWVSTDCQRVWGQHLSIENLKDESNGNLIKSRFQHEKTSTSGGICRGNVCLKMSSYPMGVLVRPDKTSWRRLSCPKNIGWSWCFGWIFWSSHHDVDDFHSLTYLIDIFP